MMEPTLYTIVGANSVELGQLKVWIWLTGGQAQLIWIMRCVDMINYRYITIACLIAAVGCITLSAQDFLKQQDESVWRNSDLIFIPKNLTHAKFSAEIQFVNGANRALPSPPRSTLMGADIGKSYSMGVQVAEGCIYYLHADVLIKTGKKPVETERQLKISVYGFNETSWTWGHKPCSTLTWNGGMAPYLLRKDLILGIATSAKSFCQGNKSHLFATFRKDEEGTFNLSSYLDSGLDKSVFMPDKSWRYPSLSTLWVAGKTARTSDLFILASGSGTCWIFDTRTGSIKSVVQLYPEVNEKSMLSGEIWDGALLSIQPKSNGDFLVSALDGSAINQGWHIEGVNRRISTGVNAKECYDFIQQSFNDILRLNPRVDWYVLDCEQKNFRYEIPPKGLPTTIRTISDYQGFDWVFKVDGNLAFRKTIQDTSTQLDAKVTKKLSRTVPSS